MYSIIVALYSLTVDALLISVHGKGTELNDIRRGSSRFSCPIFAEFLIIQSIGVFLYIYLAIVAGRATRDIIQEKGTRTLNTSYTLKRMQHVLSQK